MVDPKAEICKFKSFTLVPIAGANLGRSAGLSATRGRHEPRSEIKILDVVLGEDERRTQQNFAAVDDVELAELAGIDRGRAGFQLAVDYGADHIGRGIPEIYRVPQHDGLDATAIDIGLHRIRRGETDDGELAAQTRLGDGFGRGGRGG